MFAALRFVLVGLCLVMPKVFALDDGLRYKLIDNKSAPSSVDIDFEVPPYTLKTVDDGYTELSVPDLSLIAQEGQPELPGTGRLIEVPSGYKPVITIVSARQRYLQKILVKPHANKFRCGTHDRSKKPGFNKALYASKGSYPQHMVSVDDLGWMQGTRLARISINPFQQDFARKELMVLRTLKLRVYFVEDQRAKPTQRRSSETFSQLAHDIVINPSAAAAAPASFSQETLLIIVADAFRNSIADFVAWKKQKGFHVEVVSYSEAGGTRDGVAKYIKSSYEDASKHLTFVLLIGNAKDIPPFMRPTSDGSAASDLPFTLLSGNDNIPDVLIGRAVADNDLELGRILSRAVIYERSADPADWYAEGVTIASSEGASPSDAEYARNIQKTLKANTYAHVDDFLEAKGSATFNNIKSSLNTGRTWLTYIGHGSGTSWGSTNTTFDTTSISKLENGGRLPVVVDAACLNGAFATLRRCFGKAWVTHSVRDANAGAVAYLGASVSTTWDPPAVMANGIAKYHFEKSIPSLGASILAGQLYLVERSGMNPDTLDNFEWYNLFGDPSLVMRTASPKSYVVTSTVHDGAKAPVFEFSIKDDEGKPIEGMQVSLNNDADYAFVGGGLSDASGRVNIAGLKTVPIENYLVTVTGYNYQSVQVSSSALR